MKKYIVAIFAFGILFISACKKKESCPENTVQAPKEEKDYLRNYLDANSLVYKETNTGLFYHITDSIYGSKPTTCSNVRIKYKGTLFNGSVFDQSNNATFTLSNLIAGWQQALPLIGIGGSITIYLPPSLAYGNKASGAIPANSYLIFEIDLLGF